MSERPRNDGSKLEQLVAFVERWYLGSDFKVETNQRAYDAGAQIAEFDVSISGPVGSTQFKWLISCRDRPSDGPAPASWIRELRGVQDEFKFNKVTAVSTTGFSAGARSAAESHGIELRDVRDVAPEKLGEWFRIEFLDQTVATATPHHAGIFVQQTDDGLALPALQEVLASADTNTPFLIRSKTGEAVTTAAAYLDLVRSNGLFERAEVDGPPVAADVVAEYVNDDDHFVVETTIGRLRVEKIEFGGEVQIKRTLVPIESAVEYRRLETGGPISHRITFAEHELLDQRIAVEFHRNAESGEVRIVLRSADASSTRSDPAASTGEDCD